MKKWFDEKILSNNKKTLMLIGVLVFFVLFTYQTILLVGGKFYTSNSDDIAQYSPILRQYIEYFKSGDLSWYSFDNNFGASIFADIYYIPIDIFSFLTLLFSFFIDTTIAFSIVELTKVLLGVLVFAAFLQKCKFNNKIVLLISIIYFCSGGSWVFATYSTYFSLFFYLPLSLLVVKIFNEKKRWILPLYSFALVLYNFYNAYTLFIFMLLVYMVIKIRDDYKGIKILFKDVMVFGFHIVLGVMMGLFILIPSMLYILSYSARDTVEFQWIFDFEIYTQMIYRLFFYESGVINLNGGVGIEGIYYQRHFSYYIGFFGLYIVGLLFCMKDRESKLYKRSIIVILIMMCLPIFSMIFSGIAKAYTRWFTFFNIILLYYYAYVLKNIEGKQIDRKDKVKVLSVILSLYFAILIYYIVMFVVNGFNDKSYYAYVVFMLILSGVVGSMYLLFYLIKQEGLMKGIILVEMAISLLINLSISFDSQVGVRFIKGYDKINDLLEHVEIEEDSLERVYLSEIFPYNSNRFTRVLTNEITFHSFLTDYIYEYINYYSMEDNVSLVLYDLNNYSPNFSRIMDYKYVVVGRNEDYGINYMDVYYEDANFVVYENKSYSPFYVYENYYGEEQFLSLSEEKDFLLLTKNLFEGVILESEYYNLNKMDFDYTVKNSQYLNFVQKASLVKEGNSYVEDVNYDYGYSGTVYIRGDNILDLDSVKIVNGEDVRGCNFLSTAYSCSFDGRVDKLIFESNSVLEEFEYAVVVEDSESEYVFFDAKNFFEEEFISFVIRNKKIKMLDENGDARWCFQGFCSMNDFSVEHILMDAEIGRIIDGKEVGFFYENHDLKYYNDRKHDLFANNKKLTHNGSTINVKYDRISSSNNDQVVVLPITYSEEWVCEDENYELVRANGGFLGIVVKNGIKNIDVSIKFEPNGVKIGLLGSVLGFVIYGAYIGFMYYRKKRGK